MLKKKNHGNNLVLILFFKSEMANEKTERVQSKASFSWSPGCRHEVD